MGFSITINDVDAITLQRLETEARRRGVDVSTLARDVLRQSVPPSEAAPPSPAAAPHHDLDALAGTWSDADTREFEAAVEGFAHIDPELWK
jgi:hypothetical protein